MWTVRKCKCRLHLYLTQWPSFQTSLHYSCTVIQLFFLLQQYLRCSERLFQAKLQTVDFELSTEETRKSINTWVENKTNGKDNCVREHICVSVCVQNFNVYLLCTNFICAHLVKVLPCYANKKAEVN